MTVPILPKLLIICGPTATGKTDLALQLTKVLPAAIISADSRQVFTGMDIGTGKDKPSDNTKIWGYDLVNPDEDFSVAHFHKYAWEIIVKLWKENTLPIIVGGTGQYLDAILQPPASIDIKPDQKLRQQLNTFTTKKLQAKLQQVDINRWHHMNYSDQNNPRRLVRAIEVTLASKGVPFHEERGPLNKKIDVLWLGLTAPMEFIDQRINQRVLNRAQNGITPEVKTLMTKYPNWKFPAFSGTGYQEWRDYLESKTTKAQAISKWQLRERQYAKRQTTWFKRNPKINWYDITSPSWKKNLVLRVKTWYANNI